MQGKVFLGLGWDFPVALDEAGELRQAREEAAIKRAIHVILGTARGDRVMRPDFGSDLSRILFHPLNQATKSRVASAVQEALRRWEPRIKVLEIQVKEDGQQPATLLINIGYQIRSSNTRGNLVYPFYLRGVAP